DGSGAAGGRLHADGRRSRRAVPAVRRAWRRLEGFFWHYQNDRRQLEGPRPTIGVTMRKIAIAAVLTLAAAAAVAGPLSRDRALAVMHDRHEAMEQLGKAMKELHRGLDASPPDVNA